MTREATLDLGLVGNGTFGALVDRSASVVWACYPSFDGDPAFCSLLSPKNGGGASRQSPAVMEPAGETSGGRRIASLSLGGDKSSGICTGCADRAVE